MRDDATIPSLQLSYQHRHHAIPCSVLDPPCPSSNEFTCEQCSRCLSPPSEASLEIWPSQPSNNSVGKQQNGTALYASICSKESDTTCIRKLVRTVFTVLTDEQGDAHGLVQGMTSLAVMGVILGLVLPRNPHLNGRVYPFVSSVIGYTYCLCWSVSYYPQVVQHYRRKDTTGLSMDFCVLNIFGCMCYLCFNASMLWSNSIKDEYAQRYQVGNGDKHHNHDGAADRSSVSMVEANDLVFALHSVLLSVLWVWQVWYYNGFGARTSKPSRSTVIVLLMMSLFLTVYALVIVLSSWVKGGSDGSGGESFARSSIPGGAAGWFVRRLNWLDFLYVMTDVKVAIIMASYIPQIVLNFRNRSCGWNIWCVLLDFSGGVLSILQLVLDSWNMRDWGGITGDRGKLALGFISLVFDVSGWHRIDHILFPKEETYLCVSYERNLRAILMLWHLLFGGSHLSMVSILSHCCPRDFIYNRTLCLAGLVGSLPCTALFIVPNNRCHVNKNGDYM